jgi:hypothetical protein
MRAPNGWRCAAGWVLPPSEATPPVAGRRKGDVAGFRSGRAPCQSGAEAYSVVDRVEESTDVHLEHLNVPPANHFDSFSC